MGCLCPPAGPSQAPWRLSKFVVDNTPQNSICPYPSPGRPARLPSLTSASRQPHSIWPSLVETRPLSPTQPSIHQAQSSSVMCLIHRRPLSHTQRHIQSQTAQKLLHRHTHTSPSPLRSWESSSFTYQTLTCPQTLIHIGSQRSQTKRTRVPQPLGCDFHGVEDIFPQL